MPAPAPPASQEAAASRERLQTSCSPAPAPPASQEAAASRERLQTSCSPASDSTPLTSSAWPPRRERSPEQTEGLEKQSQAVWLSNFRPLLVSGLLLHPQLWRTL